MTPFTYLLIDLLSVAVPFAYSFTARSGFSKRFGPALAAVGLVAVPMIAWDALFTSWGVWGFNAAYHLNARLFGLPFEEVLFFICIPFSCLFIYDSLEKYPRLFLPDRASRIALIAAAAALALTAGLNFERVYTASAFAIASVAAVLAAGRLPRGRAGLFAAAYLAHLVPFFLVNGLLTALPVVVYNDAENLGFRLGTIPVEDAGYSLILLAGTVLLYERFRRRRV